MKKVISFVIAGTLLAGIVALAEQDTSGGSKKTQKKKKKGKKTNASPSKKI